MSAQPVGSRAYASWSPDPGRQREASYTIEDILALSDDAPWVELRNGVMSVVPSPTLGHQRISGLLFAWLVRQAPGEFLASMATGLAVGVKKSFEPDVLLLRAAGVQLDRHFVTSEHVVLAVEVVSPGTRRQDRLEKPVEYAAAGVPFYWRIEQDPVHLFAYELGADDSYRLVADSDQELVLTRPFAINLLIGDITP